jgi:Flp pilus assembly protein TadG
MAVEKMRARKSQSRDTLTSNQEGQSIIEFLFMLPLFVGLIVILIRVNTAIQVSLVNQQYARAQALWLTFNSPVYPSIFSRSQNLAAKGYNQMLIGVADNREDENGNYRPKATVQNVARQKNVGSNDPQTEPPSRALVRVRTTVTLCTQSEVVKTGGTYQPILASNELGVGGTSAMSEDPQQFDFCRSPQL